MRQIFSMQAAVWAFSIIFYFCIDSLAFGSPFVQRIEPEKTDASITNANTPHIVITEGRKADELLFVWLTGTDGMPDSAAWPMFDTALGAGYDIVALSYIDTPAVAQLCRDENVAKDPDCAAHFRQKRTFGDNVSSLISDQPQDAIVHRLTALLKYLASRDSTGRWNGYLENDEPKWSKIIVAGQSQGGGMAAFIAKQKHVAGVMDFSGGWDMSGPGKIAKWYSNPSATTPEVWYGTYGAKEPDAKAIADSYAAMKIPKAHLFPLNRPTKFDAHGAGSADPVYQDIWVQMLQHK